MGWFVAGLDATVGVILIATLPEAAVETAVVPPVGLAHVGLGIVIGGGLILIGGIIAYEGVQAIRQSGVIPGTSP